MGAWGIERRGYGLFSGCIPEAWQKNGIKTYFTGILAWLLVFVFNKVFWRGCGIRKVFRVQFLQILYIYIYKTVAIG